MRSENVSNIYFGYFDVIRYSKNILCNDLKFLAITYLTIS